MKFVPFGESNELSASYIVMDEKDNEIGSVEGYTNKKGELVSVVKVYATREQKKGLGFKAFKKVYDELNSSVKIKIIKGCWHSGGEFQGFEDGMSTNLKCFFEQYESGQSDEESAFSTPTGKWARKLGYTRCKVVSISKTETNVDFIKEDNSS